AVGGGDTDRPASRDAEIAGREPDAGGAATSAGATDHQTGAPGRAPRARRSDVSPRSRVRGDRARGGSRGAAAAGAGVGPRRRRDDAAVGALERLAARVGSFRRRLPSRALSGAWGVPSLGTG